MVTLCLLKVFMYIVFSSRGSRKQISDLLIDIGIQFSLLNCTDSLNLQLFHNAFSLTPAGAVMLW